jgi:hypothetical protein
LILATGTVFETVSDVTYGRGGTAVEAITLTVGLPTTVASQLAVSATGGITSTSDAAALASGRASFRADVTRYYNYDATTASLREFGSEIQSQNGRAVLVNTPFVEARFGMPVGASFTQEYVISTTATPVSGGSVMSAPSYTKTVTYAGIEAITVPAGTFFACKFVETGTSIAGPGRPVEVTPRSTQWIGRGSGIALRTTVETLSPITGDVVSTDTYQLRRATINRALLVP